jgi:hypothetical protein
MVLMMICNFENWLRSWKEAYWLYVWCLRNIHYAVWYTATSVNWPQTITYHTCLMTVRYILIDGTEKHSLLKFLIQQKAVAQNGCWKDYNKYSETWQEWWLEVTKQQLNTTFTKQLNYLTLLPQASAHEMPHANHVKRKVLESWLLCHALYTCTHISECKLF